MGLLDTLKNVFKPNVGSDAEPSSLASASTYTIPANKNGSTTGSNFNIGSNTGVHANVVPGSNNGITGTPVPLVNSGNEVGVRAGITSGIDKGAGKASYSPGATDTTKAGSLNIVNSTTTNNKTTNTTFKPKVGQTEDSISVRAGNDERFKYDRASDKLSERAHRAGLRAGEDYDNISDDQREYIDTYYNTLDRAEITKPFLELEQIMRDQDYSSDKFDTKYQQLMNYIDAELEAERKANGATSKQYQALEQVKRNVDRLNTQYAIDKQHAQKQEALGQLDENINAIFAGVMNSRDYDSTVNAGRQAVSQNSSAKKWFDKNMANASETQLDLMYYTYQKEGLAGVKELYNDYMGETLAYADASKDFISDIVNNPDKGGRFWEAAKANVASTLGGTGSYLSSIKQMFSDTESDPSNRELIAGYTANDAIDTSLRDELGAIADSPEFEQIGNEGFAMMRAYGVNDDWYKDAAKNATDFQKQFLGYMFAATDGDATAVQAVWESIKESEEEIWQQVKGANTLPYGRDTVEGDIYRKYLGLSGGKAPTWLGGGDGQTMSQLLWDAASTVNGQVPQLIGNLAGLALALIPGGQALAPFASRVLGAGAMTIGAYGNTYKATRDEGYNKTKSGVYAGADAAMEFISDYLFSGIGPVKGLLNNKMTSKIVANIANPIARAFSKLGINMLSEGGQEYFQAINEPLMRNVLLGESNDFSLYTEEAKYNFFMGAFSAAILGSLDADTNLMRQVRENVQNKDIGQALKAQGSAKKLVDVVLNQEVAAENKEQQEKVDEAKEFAKSLLDGDFKESDTNVGELLSKAAEAGFDLSFLTNPDTVSYTKEQLSVDDLRAGAVSRLAALGGNTEMAEDVAKLAKGMSVSEESQSAIQKDTAATQVLQELQGELNLEENNALTIAARSSQVDGTFAKITAAVQANNPDKTILSPNAQFIKEQGVGLADAQRIGAVFDKVMDGHQITKDEAKLVNVRNKGINGALLARLDIDLLETASTDAVMKALNEKAAQVARVKDMQAGVKQATQARVSGQSGTTPASKATQSARQRRRGKKNGTKGTSVQAQAGTEAAAGVSGQLAGSSTGAPQAGNPRGTAGTGPASAGGPGGVRAEDGSSQIGRNAPVRGPGDGDVGEVIPVDQLTEKQRNIQRRLAADGFGSIHFMNGGVSHVVWNEDLGCYEVYIRADGPFNIDQYGDHETGHLWVKALSVNDKHDFLRLVKNVFGEDFREAFTQIRQKYVGLGVFPKDVDEDTVVEEMYCFARGAQNCAKKGLKDSILKFDFSKYHDAMLEIEQFAALEDMAKGNLNNEQVRQNYENGNFNREYYERQGYLDEDFAPAPVTQAKTEEKKPTIPAKKEKAAEKPKTENRTEAKKALDKLASKKGETSEKTEKATEAKTEEPKSKKAAIPAKSEVDKLKEHYDQRKAAQQRKFDEGKLAKTEEQLQNKLKKLDNEYQHKLIDLYKGEDGKFTATPEAIARAENLSDEVRNDLISELAGLQAELKADSSIADNTGFLNRVQAWFDKANAALNEANKPKVSALQELRSRAEQLVANPELANDPEFVRRNEELLALATAEMAERAANAQVDAEQLAEEASQEAQPEAQPEAKQEKPKKSKPFDYDAELKKLDDWREARRKSQYAKMEKNPEKTDASLNAQLKKIEDEYTYKKQALAAKARKNGDTRFSVDPDMNTEENNGRADAVRESYGRAVGSAGGRGTDSRGPGSIQGTEGKSLGSRGQVSGRESVKNKTLARAQFEERKRRLKASGAKILSSADVHPDISAAGDFIKRMIPGANVCYYSDPNDRRDAFFVFRKDTGTDSGIFINAARFDGGVTKDGIPAHKIAVHETGHYYLAYAAMASGVSRKAELAADCFRYVRDQISANSENAEEVLEELADVFEVYRDRYSELTSSDQVMEELVNDLFARNDADFFDEDAFDAVWPIVREWFQANTEYGSLNDNERASFSVDPDEDFDVEELMDRTDEMRSGYNEAQIWQDSSLNEEDVADTTTAQPSAEDDYDSKMDALMAEMDAHPERMEEIISQMTALAEERNASNTRALEERSAKPKPKKTEAKKTEPAKAETKTEPKKPVIPPKTEPKKAEAKTEKAETKEAEAKTEPKKAEKPAAAKAFQPKPEKAKPAPVNEAAPELKKPELHRGQNPVDVKGLSKKKAIDKVTRAKADYEAWYAQEKGKLDQQYDSKKLDDARYAKEITKLTERRNKDVGRYNDQLKRLEVLEEAVKEKPTVVKDKETTYTPKVGEWWRRIKNGTNIQIRRLRSDRNTYDVSFTDSKGNQVVYESVSPSMLEKALGEGLRKKADAKAMLSTAYESAASSLGEWQSVDYAKRAEEVKPGKPKPDKTLDNYGRKISYQMETRMANSTVRDQAGRLMSVYRLGPANGTQNANPNARYTLWAERPATMNLMRGLNGVEAYDQAGKKVGANIEKWLQELEEHPKMSEGNKNAIRAKIAAAERKMREYTTHITRLDPFRPGYTNPNREDVIGNHTLLEGYVDIRNPLVIDAKGKGMAFVRDTIQDFVNDPANLAGQVDVDGNALGEHDGIKFINVTVTDGNKSLGGGQLDRDTIYATFRANQGKSTYNTAPTDSELMQYSLDPEVDDLLDEYDKEAWATDPETAEIIGIQDLKGNRISKGTAEFFKGSVSINNEGDAVDAIIPLWLSSNAFGFLAYDTSHSDDGISIFLSDNQTVGASYAKGGDRTVDLVAHEKMLQGIADQLGVPIKQLPLMKTLWDSLLLTKTSIEQADSARIQEAFTAASRIQQMYNAALNTLGLDNQRIAGVRMSRSTNEIQENYSLLRDAADVLDDLASDLVDAIGGLRTLAVSNMSIYSELDTLSQFQDTLKSAGGVMFDRLASPEMARAKLAEIMPKVKSAVSAIEESYLTDLEEDEQQELEDDYEDTMFYLNLVVDSAEATVERFLTAYENFVPSFVAENGETISFSDINNILPDSASWAVYARTRNPFIVDGGYADGTPGMWFAIDMSGNPDYAIWVAQQRAKGFKYSVKNAKTRDIARYAYDRGYDSAIIKNIVDAGSSKAYGIGSNIYVVFNPEQIKSVNNLNPTDSEMMNHSIDPDTETGYPEGSWQNAVLQVLHDKDYDHAVESLTLYLAQYLQTGVVPEIDNEQTRKIFQPRITPAEHTYLNERARELIDRYHAFKPGENPARQVFMPKERADGNVRQTYRTAAEASATPEWGVDFLMREALTSDDAVYQKITDKSAIAAANRDMRSKGYEQMLAEWRAKADGDAAYKIDKNDIAKAVALYSEAFSAGNAEDAMAIIAEIAEVETTSAQIVQAARLIKHMPPSYQLYYLRRVVNRLNNQYRKRIDSGRMSEIKINKDLAKAVLNAKNQEELDKAMQALIEDVAKNVPVTGWDQWNAWRYLSMLGNPKTHIRNIFGNALFVPAKFSKDLIAAGLEGMFIKNRLERRTSLKGVVGRNSEYRDFAKQDYEGIKQELQSGGKYNMTNEIMNARTIFKWSKGLEFLRKFNGEWLEKEDGAFLRFHYVNALTNFLTTQGMSVKDLQTTPEGRKIMNAARLYAFNEAQKATYRDASQVAAALNQLKQKSGPMGLLFEGVFPFAKTPVNILKRGVEYSPIGLLDSLSRGLVQLKNGTITANELIDRIASGLTGTGVVLLGMWLSSMGLLRGGSDDDEKQDEFSKLQGYQNYSINLGDYNYTIDWAAPVALPLFVGCELINQMREGGQLSLSDWINAALVVAEPLTQLSMLSGVNELLTSAKWDKQALASAIMTSGSSYITQAFPTLVAQLSRSITPDRRTTYVDKNSDIPQPIQRWWQTNVMGKTPLNAQRTEYIDAWGRKDTTANFAVRLFENMFSPGYINRVNTTPVDEELQKLADSVGTGVLMTVPERSLDFNNETHHLTAKQYQTYAKTRGDAAMEMLTDLFNSEGYQNDMTDDEKAYAVNAIKQYADILGKQAVFSEYDSDYDNWAEKCDGDQTRITNMAMLRAQAHELGVKTNSTAFHTVILNASYLTPVDQAYAIAQTLDLGNDAYVYETGKSSIKYAINADDKNLIEEHYRQIFPAYYLPVAQTDQWINATLEERTKLLSQVRSDAKADAKAWLATIKAAQGAPLYVKK